MARMYFIGFMGSGKSTLGKRIATKLNLNFIDLDAQIEEQEKASIAQLFEKYGEAEFRKIEQKHLHETKHLTNIVIATGGGTPCFFDNLDWMNANGLTCYLYLPPKTLAQRLQTNKENRPLISKINEDKLEEFIATKLEERANFYRNAKIQMNVLRAKEKSLIHFLIKLKVVNKQKAR